MKSTKLLCVLSLIAASSLSGMAIAKPLDSDSRTERSEMQHGKAHQAMQRMLASLDLTDSQKVQIKALVEQQHAKYSASKQDHSLQKKLQSLVVADSFDEVAARSVLEQQQQQHIERRLAGMKLQHDIRQLLTEEQRQQLAEKQQKMQQKRQLRRNGD